MYYWNSFYGTTIRKREYIFYLTVLFINRDYENVQRWGLPSPTSFAIDKTLHSESCEEYSKVHFQVLDACRKLVESWSLTLCLRGRYLDVAKPTVLIVHDTIQSNWEQTTAVFHLK